MELHGVSRCYSRVVATTWVVHDPIASRATRAHLRHRGPTPIACLAGCAARVLCSCRGSAHKMSFDFRRDIAPFLVATIGEFVALTAWLVLLGQHRTAAADVLLWSGFAIERLAVAIWVRRVYAPGEGVTSSPLWEMGVFIIVITIAEVAIWSVWLDSTGARGILAAGVLLLVLIHVLHSIEMGTVKRKNPLVYAANIRTIFFSIMEAAGATAWIALRNAHHPLRGALALLIGLTLEHIIQGGTLKPDPLPALPPPGP
jgi:hypothetical protein